VIATPTLAALCASWAKVAAGSRSQPSTTACTNLAPVSFDRRWTKPVARAACSATSVNTYSIARATSGILAIWKLLDHWDG
jgi:hypothetical protein